MPSSPDITELWGNFKNLVKKITYDKTEVDNKLSQKANNSLVSQSSNGLMSSTDKVKLDGIAAGANKITVDSTLSSSSTNPVQNKVINTALSGKANSSHSHSAVTTSVNGFMSSADKTKLNGIATGANKTIVDSALSTASTNPVQNKVINSEITSLKSTVTNKADKNHTHSSLSGGVSYRQVDNDYDGLPVYCSIKNGFAFLTWRNPFQYLNSNGSIKQTGVYFQIGYVAAPDIDEGSIYQLGSNWRLKINKDGKLEGFVDIKDAWTYGTWVYPTSSTSLLYPDD